MFNKKESSQEIDRLEEEIEIKPVEVLEDVEKTLREDIEKLEDKLKRTMAEFDNFRKRTLKEKSTMYDEGIRTTVEKILPVLDNLERAIATDTEFLTPSSVEYETNRLVLGKTSGDTSGLRQGLEMTLRQFTEILNDMDVKEIEAQEKEFNPNFHLAVVHVEDESYRPNTVIEVLQKGYIHKDKVIRYSTVKVAN